jgi:hypothetical protein
MCGYPTEMALIEFCSLTSLCVPRHRTGRACAWTPATLQEWIGDPRDYKAANEHEAAKVIGPVRHRRNTERLKLSRIRRRKFRTQVGHRP